MYPLPIWSGCKKMVCRRLKKNGNRLYAMFACADLYSLAIAGRKLFVYEVPWL